MYKRQGTLCVCISMMDHIKTNHLDQKLSSKSYFLEGVDVDALIEETIQYPRKVADHMTKPRRKWLLGRFKQVIGRRGIDGAKCYWLVVLLDDFRLITAYPVPHPKTLPFMR